MTEPTDLIYEGIATIFLKPVVFLRESFEPTDLIYEGIATFSASRPEHPSTPSRPNQPT